MRVEGSGSRVKAFGIEAAAARATQGPLWGYLKVNFSETLSIFGDKCPRNGSKNEQTAPRTNTAYPHKGVCVVPRGAFGTRFSHHNEIEYTLPIALLFTTRRQSSASASTNQGDLIALGDGRAVRHRGCCRARTCPSSRRGGATNNSVAHNHNKLTFRLRV